MPCAASLAATVRRLAGALALALAAGHAPAGVLNDLWWNPEESGWGINVVEQGDVLFLTLFVYGAEGKPAWYVGPETRRDDYDIRAYTGPLYATTGPWFGQSFDAHALGVRRAGTITFTLQADGTAALRYAVDGVQVDKAIRRQFVRHIPISPFGDHPDPTMRTTTYVGTFQLAEISLGCNVAGPYLDSQPTGGAPAPRFALTPTPVDERSGLMELRVAPNFLLAGSYVQEGSVYTVKLAAEISGDPVTYLPPGKYTGEIRQLVVDGSFVHGYVRMWGDKGCYMGFAMAGHVPVIAYYS